MSSTYSTLNGWILSQNYPHNYHDNVDVTLTVNYPNPTNGRMILIITSVTFEMESCCDYLYVNSDSGTHSYNGDGGSLRAGNIVRCKFTTGFNLDVNKKYLCAIDDTI